MSTIYLDHNSTTPVDPAVAEAMQPYLRGTFGNPSSAHALGPPARQAVERARAQVAHLLGAEPDEIIFTSGASESNNALIKGLAFASTRRPHVVTTAIEHPSVLKSCRFLEERGLADVTVLGVDGLGQLRVEEVERALRPDTALVSVMHANNEVGTVQPVAAVAAAAHRAGALVHCDAAQSVGKLPVRVDDLQVDFLSLAGHKVYAPKGVGALFQRRGTRLEPLIHGAGHEAGRRAGTENVPYVVGLGTACALAAARVQEAGARMEELRDLIHRRLVEALGEDRLVVNGHPRDRLPNTLNVCFLGTTGAEVLAGCAELAASTGPACHDGQVRLSHVLEALGIPLEVGRGAVRLSLGWHTTRDEAERAAEALVRAYRKVASDVPV